MTEEIILKKLTELADSKYKSFSAKLTPSVKAENVTKYPSSDLTRCSNKYSVSLRIIF